MTFLTNVAKIMAKYWQVFLIQGIGYRCVQDDVRIRYGK